MEIEQVGSEKSLQERAVDALDYVKALEVEDQKSLDEANKVIVRIGQIRKGIIAYFKDPKTKAKAAHQAIVDKEKEALTPLNEAEENLKPRIGSYVMTQRRIQEEAERKAREEAERIELEQEEALKKAAALENEGKAQEAQAKLDEAEKMDESKAQVDIPAAPVMSGTHTVIYTRWRVIDPQLVPRQYLMYDRARIDDEVKRHKMATKIPGIEVYEETDVRRSRT